VRTADFVDEACCRSCGGWRRTLVTLHGADAKYYLCDGCLWWERRAWGPDRSRCGDEPRREPTSASGEAADCECQGARS
jgi:hypothetical protein